MNGLIAAIQRLLATDKTAITAAIVQVAIALTAGLGLHLNGTDVAILSSIVSGGVGWVIHQHFKINARYTADRFIR